MEAEAFDAAPSPYTYHDESPQSPSLPQTPTETAYFDYKPSALINESEEDYVTEDDNLLAIDPAPSGRTSISSFPASIVHHDIRQGEHWTPPRSNVGTPTSNHYLSGTALSLATREYVTGFRNPSSVRALQMRDEDSDGEDYTPNHKRRGSRMSYMSYRSGSTHSTPGKRLSRSLQGSPVKGASKLRKEFPLVLLHCTLLPGLISPKAKLISGDTLEAILPEPYKQRWRTLQERVVENSEVRDRGVLIPHPKEDYDMLEERLLESLELEQSRINSGHYADRSESRASVADSGFGSDETSSWGDCPDKEDQNKCADCGQKLCGEKKWELKIYAANGLMRAGAWAAAWSEMEKIDVQVALSIPEDVRLEIETRLDAVILQEQEMREQERLSEHQAMDFRKREVYGEPRRQEEIDGLDDTSKGPQSPLKDQVQVHATQSRQERRRERKAANDERSRSPIPKADLPDVLLNYIRLLSQDRRNITIALLSLLIIFYAMANQQTRPVVNETAVQNAVENLRETMIEYLTTTVVSTSVSTSTSTSVALQTSTVTETATTTETRPASVSITVQEPTLEVAELNSSAIIESDPPTTTVSLKEDSETVSIPANEAVPTKTETEAVTTLFSISTETSGSASLEQAMQTSPSTSLFHFSKDETLAAEKLSSEFVPKPETVTDTTMLEQTPNDSSNGIFTRSRDEL